jgi:hypothetical protein
LFPSYRYCANHCQWCCLDSPCPKLKKTPPLNSKHDKSEGSIIHHTAVEYIPQTIISTLIVISIKMSDWFIIVHSETTPPPHSSVRWGRAMSLETILLVTDQHRSYRVDSSFSFWFPVSHTTKLSSISSITGYEHSVTIGLFLTPISLLLRFNFIR